jgi:hypothetical protein
MGYPIFFSSIEVWQLKIGIQDFAIGWLYTETNNFAGRSFELNLWPDGPPYESADNAGS